jgi:ribonuclease BN (tRNA processing enzyme)
MKLYFLGTNGWYDTKTGNTLSVLLDTDQAYIVFDAGNGFYKLDKYIKESKPIILQLSHFHLDHIIGLHVLNKFNFRQGINIFGPQGVKKALEVIINSPYTLSLKKLKTKINVKEFSNDLKLPVDIKHRRLLHSTLCYGYRVSAEGKAIVFCTDTGLCENLKLLAKDADIFITESSLASGKIDKHWPHLNPEQAAKVARAAKVKRLILAHFDAAVYLTGKDRLLAQRAARKIFKNTLSAQDGLVEKI